jgi:hypothetical protein
LRGNREEAGEFVVSAFQLVQPGLHLPKVADTIMNALSNQEARLFLPSEQWQNETGIH